MANGEANKGKLEVEGRVVTLTMAVALEGGLSSDYRLKLNSYSYDLDKASSSRPCGPRLDDY